MQAYDTHTQFSRHASKNSSHTTRHGQGQEEGVSLSRAISPRKRDSTSMASEYLVLTDLASKLGTYVQNGISSQPSHRAYPHSLSQPELTRKVFRTASRSRQGNINDDAKLLLNLKDVITRPDETEECVTPAAVTALATTISPSLSFEARRHYEGNATKTKNSRNVRFFHPERDGSQQCDLERTFSLSCPSLSLQETNPNVPVAQAQAGVSAATIPKKPANATPSQLFSRPILKRSSLNVDDIAESLASNVMQSFTTALEWRTKVWAKQLSKSASCKYNQELARLQKGASKKQGKKSEKKKPAATNNKCKKAGMEALKNKFKKSQEARVIHALSQASSSIIVHDVRTTFFILEQQQQLNAAPIEQEEEKKDYSDHTAAVPLRPRSQVFRPLKKRRTIPSARASVSSSTESEAKNLNPTKYTLSHALNFDSRCSVSTSGEKKISVSLQTPGIIHGTFVRNEDGDVSLVDVSIRLNTQSLALSMEQKTRLVVRTAAKECIISPPSTTQYKVQKSSGQGMVSDDASCDESADEGLYHHHNDSYTSRPSVPNQYQQHHPFTPRGPFVTPRNGFEDQAVVTVTPREYECVSSDSDEMPPPPPRLPLESSKTSAELEGRTSILNPRRVSPTYNSSRSSHTHNGILESPTPGKATYLDAPSKTLSPTLVSPYLTSEILDSQSKLDSKGPLLPVLVEVACAVHTLCN